MIHAIEGKRHSDKQYKFPFLLNGVNMGEEERITSKPLYVVCIAHICMLKLTACCVCNVHVGSYLCQRATGAPSQGMVHCKYWLRPPVGHTLL